MQKNICKHKVAFFALNSPPLTRDVTCSKLQNCRWNTLLRFKLTKKYHIATNFYYHVINTAMMHTAGKRCLYVKPKRQSEYVEIS